MYTYVENNPIIYSDPTGNMATAGPGVGGDSSLGQVRDYSTWKFDNTAKGFYLAQQYYAVWYYGTQAYDRLDEGSLQNNSYLVYTLWNMQKKERTCLH